MLDPGGTGGRTAFASVPTVIIGPVEAHAIVAHTLLSRLDAAAHLAPTLAANAAVVLVTDPAGETPSPDMGLVRVLIEATICNHGGKNVQVAVIDGTRSPEAIIGAALPPTASGVPYPTIDPHLAFADWRNEMICLSSLDPWT
jgi:hypothetical protein